ncbi:terpene synthase family protein [Streptomyces sp. NPDC050804]|uniref:terpene synthase family protein n=1 Tax=Streptomyces sp. NPDC050804 TaxID=3154745 RepID=UPI00341D636D
MYDNADISPGADLFHAVLWGDLGFGRSSHPRTDTARDRNLSWLRGHGFFASAAADDWYRSWDLEGLVGGVYPYADDTGLDRCNKATTFMTVFDDQFEGQPGDTSTAAAVTVRSYLDVIDGRPVAGPVSPLKAMFAEIWQDWSTAAMSAEWHARARDNWVYCLTAMAHERASLRTGEPLAPDQYLELRRGTSYMPLFLDLIELAGGTECPRVIKHAPPVRIMRLITMDIVNFMNDVLSLHKEMARGDNDNIVLTTRYERRCSLAEAISLTCEEIAAKARRFTELRAGLPGLCAGLGLSGEETSAAVHYAYALERWIGGYEPWQRRSPRYQDAFAQRPPRERWAFEMGGKDS